MSNYSFELLRQDQRGSKNVVATVLQFASKTKIKIDVCMDHTRPGLVLEIDQIRQCFLDAKCKGIRLRLLTEITADNIISCKRLSSLVDEFRHLDGIKGSFYISEVEYLALAIFHEEGRTASQIIYSNVMELVEHQQYVFDTLWSKSIPAQEKVREIE